MLRYIDGTLKRSFSPDVDDRIDTRWAKILNEVYNLDKEFQGYILCIFARYISSSISCALKMFGRTIVANNCQN